MAIPVYFLSVEIENYRCFRSKQVLDLSDGKGNWKKWTVILGDNGLGKTSLLQLLAAGATEERIHGSGDIDYGPSTRVLMPLMAGPGNLAGTINFGLDLYYIKSEARFEKMPGFKFRGIGMEISVHNDARLKELICFGYGATRKMGINSLTNLSGPTSESLFNDDFSLINAEEWLLQLDYAASKDSDIKAFAIKKRDQVKQMLINLLPDIANIRFSVPTRKNLISTIEFQTPFGWVSIHQLSLGYKTMVTWMIDLAARMFERYPNSQDPLSEPAIVLVDEIDLHLHPKWQKNIFNYLSDKFPQTQFIVTAHSPLVVQSAPRDANIVLLRKDDDHVVIDNDLKSVQNWRIDQILTSDLFGLESARGEEAEKKLAERKELLSKEDLTREEKMRLDELNSFVHQLPIAYNTNDIEAMSIVQEAAEYLKKQQKK